MQRPPSAGTTEALRCGFRIRAPVVISTSGRRGGRNGQSPFASPEFGLRHAGLVESYVHDCVARCMRRPLIAIVKVVRII